jgi:hypothetical protein
MNNVVQFKRKLEKPSSVNDEGEYFFPTMNTGWAVGGVHLSGFEVLSRVQQFTGQSGSLEYDGEDLWFVPTVGSSENDIKHEEKEAAMSKPLEKEFADVLHDNINDLYES